MIAKPVARTKPKTTNKTPNHKHLQPRHTKRSLEQVPQSLGHCRFPRLIHHAFEMVNFRYGAQIAQHWQVSVRLQRHQRHNTQQRQHGQTRQRQRPTDARHSARRSGHLLPARDILLCMTSVCDVSGRHVSLCVTVVRKLRGTVYVVSWR